MYQVLPQILAADHIADLHREAERQRQLNELRNRHPRPPRRRAIRRRRLFRQPRPARA
ncbi:MAG TPA: hypothetical protein VJ735_04130 [Actinomycetes bacterium]|nr:hypothetical protein [Actinomycetes bacterium]